MDTLKKIYKKLLLVIIYTIIACTVYGYWFQALWGKWYITLITVVIIVAAGAVIGYLYMKNDLKPKTEEKKEEQVETKETN